MNFSPQNAQHLLNAHLPNLCQGYVHRLLPSILEFTVPVHKHRNFSFICRSSKDGLCNGLKIRGFPIVTGGRHEIMGSHVPRRRMGFANLLEGFDFLWLHEKYAFQSKPGDWTRLKPGVAQSDSEGRHETLWACGATLVAQLLCTQKVYGFESRQVH